MKQNLFFIAITLLVCGQCYAQKSLSVNGKIIDAANHPMSSAAITLFSNKGQTVKIKSDSLGMFVFKKINSLKVTLTVSAQGYLTVSKHYDLSPSGSTYLGAIVLIKAATGQLAGLKPVTIKVDTVQYTASSYKTNGATADLLKKLPGSTIDANGNLSFRGQQISKVRINGKDYAGDISGATRNLPADVMQQVQVVQDYGNQAAMTGIKSGEPGTILNINTNGGAGNEAYKKIPENNFNTAAAAQLSTFSIDVDAASYANVRRFINNGYLPPADAVRIEEMINYFKYNLAGPVDNSPVAIHTELSSAPWNANHRLLRIGLKAKTIEQNNLPPSNLVFLIDVSGSMNQANKLPLVKSSMKMLVEQLREKDKVAIVTYAGNAGLALAATPGDKKEDINNAIDNLEAGGSTAGGEGLKLAYKIARENFMPKGNNRIIMATDGDFNVGPSSDGDMEQLITNERDSKVAISILGFGMGNLKDSKMETMADKGNGNYAYIDNFTEAQRALVSEFDGTLFTVATDVKIQVEFNPAKVQAYRLLGYEDRMLAKEDFNNDMKDAGDMGSGHSVTALYEIVPAGVKDDYAGNVDPLKYQKPAPAPPSSSSDEMMTIKFRYKEPQSGKSKLKAIAIKDNPKALGATSDDFRFAAAVAEFGMLLRESDYKQGASFEQAISIAKGAKANDEEGYRSEFVRLAGSARLLAKKELAANK